MSATVHCLTSCAIGEILGLVPATRWGLANGPSIALAVALAFLFSYSLTIVAVAVAFAADTVSIVVMKITDNAIMLAVPGAMKAGLTDVLFWGSLAVSLLVSFAVTVPVNRTLIARGKGHAGVHQYHH